MLVGHFRQNGGMTDIFRHTLQFDANDNNNCINTFRSDLELYGKA